VFTKTVSDQKSINCAKFATDKSQHELIGYCALICFCFSFPPFRTLIKSNVRRIADDAFKNNTNLQKL
jgi:hypothetical protein